MYKEVILFALVAQSLPLQAVDWKDINWWKMNPTYWLTQTHPALPVNLSNHAFGVVSSNGVTMTENAVKVSDSFVKGAEELGTSFVKGAEKAGECFVKGTEVLKDPKAIEAAANAASYGTGHGFVYGAVTAPFHAARDGAVYVKDTAIEHPVLATAVLLGAAYYQFGPLTEAQKQQQQIEKDKRQLEIRAAASVVKADMFADEYRTCLNRHAYDHGSSCDDKIKRCHSPARKLAMENKKRAAKITKAYREYA